MSAHGLLTRSHVWVEGLCDDLRVACSPLCPSPLPGTGTRSFLEVPFSELPTVFDVPQTELPEKYSAAPKA